MSEIIHGRDLILSINNVAVGGARSCEIMVQTDEIETSSASQGGWKEYIAGMKGWSLTCSHFITLYDDDNSPRNSDLIGAPGFVGQTVSVKFWVRGDSENFLTGSAIVKSWKGTGTIPNLSQGSFSFLGTGPLTIGAVTPST